MKFFGREYHNLADEELATMVRNGNEKAFRTLYGRYSKKLINFISRLINDPEKAQDILHDVFMKFIEKPEAFDPKRKFSTWLYSIAVNLSRNEFKRSTRFQEFDEDYIMPVANTQDLQFDIAEFHKLLENELINMDLNHRSVFIMRYKEELSVREIADILGCPEGTVKSRLFYANKILSSKLYMYNPKTRL